MIKASLIVLVTYVTLSYVVFPIALRRQVFEHIPMVTRNFMGEPGDPLNISVVGSEAQVIETFIRAGWRPADKITWHTCLKMIARTVLSKSYPTAPMSKLFLWNRPQDLAFQQPTDTPKMRSHVRLWLTNESLNGTPVWVAAATYDVAVGINRKTGAFTHYIDPNVDAERDAVVKDIRLSNKVSKIYHIEGCGKQTAATNGDGCPYFTDGKICVVVLDSAAF
jgi:hypothetical protein